MTNNISLKIYGVVNRNCEKCGKPGDCNCFEIKGNRHMMCSACTFEEFNYGKKKKEKDELTGYEICTDCGLLTMRMYKEKTEMTNNEMIRHFECDKCGRVLKKKTKRYKE